MAGVFLQLAPATNPSSFIRALPYLHGGARLHQVHHGVRQKLHFPGERAERPELDGRVAGRTHAFDVFFLGVVVLVIVTGMVVEFARLGADVAIWSRGKEHREAGVAAVEEAGGRAGGQNRPRRPPRSLGILGTVEERKRHRRRATNRAQPPVASRPRGTITRTAQRR